MEIVTLAGQLRSDLGKKATSAIRRQGEIPAVVYGGGEPVHLTISPKEVRHLIYTPDFKLANITVDGHTHKCLVKDVQYHPVNEQILHIDFLRLVAGESIKVEIPVRFRGSSPGVRAGGKLLQLMRRVKIKTTPENLVNEAIVDISKMELGQSIRVRDIDSLRGVEVLSGPSIPVATIEIPRALRSAATAAAKGK